MKKKLATHILTFRITKEENAQFEALCNEMGIKRSMMLNIIVRNILNKKIKLTKAELVSVK